MASSFANFLSFLLPSKPPPPQALPQTLPKPRQSSRDDFAPISLSQAQDQAPVPPPVDLSASIMCPSLAYANTLYFSSGYNVQVLVEDNEPEERLLGRFRREVMKAGVIQECKRRRFFENSQDERKRKTREAAKRNRRRRTISRAPAQNKPETSANEKSKDEDNWEMPEEDIPF
ncbi:30S ribosomal protein S21, chloroplastic [Punica granatum]|uniref:Uncharacterized protein n=2 Tax=Punica granatum TaxID=22663 RepID=A0A218WF26_PUNGR|nr:30S ribosomal protein S21, chloroplastic [Punica granatum]OWM71437.1 hypothetical protein CDL15_Pgr005624 [Punica granatum]PKI60349.1 hypothetical protein CRG98_019285 [Punica granatum]